MASNYIVTGTALACSVESGDIRVDGLSLGEGLNATNVWRIAGMCTHDADNLQGDINIDKKEKEVRGGGGGGREKD